MVLCSKFFLDTAAVLLVLILVMMDILWHLRVWMKQLKFGVLMVI